MYAKEHKLVLFTFYPYIYLLGKSTRLATKDDLTLLVHPAIYPYT